MLEGQGLFQLAARSESNAALQHSIAAGYGAPHTVFQKSDKTGFDLGAVTVSANTTIRAILQAAWDELTKDENRITGDMLQRLEKASKSDNKEIAAQRLAQAKQKLRSLRLQAQIAAAAGDKKALRRIAQLAAQAAHEVASAARGLASGIAASATAGADVSTSGNVPIAAVGTSETQQDDTSSEDTGSDSALGGFTFTATPPADADTIAQDRAAGRDALKKLGDEARSAIIEARGIIAFAAQAARHKRRHDDSDDDDYRDLKQSVQDAARDLDHALNAAGQSLLGIGSDAVSAIETTTVAVQVTTEVSVTASVVI